MTSAGKELNLNFEDDSDDPSVVDEDEDSDNEVSNVCASVCVREEWPRAHLAYISVHSTPEGTTY